MTVRLRNTGHRTGDEVVQLYLHDVLAEVTRPVRQLVGFVRITVEAGAAADITFHLHADRTAFVGRDRKHIVEAGRVEVFVGTSVSDTPCTGAFRLTGPLRTVGHNRRLVTPVDVTGVVVT